MTTDAAWQVWVDTGGTFTDCLALAPDGGVHRAKVLSSSALRGTVAERLGPRDLRVLAGWEAPAGFVDGFVFRLLGRPATDARVRLWDPDSGLMSLTGDPGTEADAGETFEVQSPEEAPILAARLVTGTLPQAPLPTLAMRVATTRGTNALLTRSGARTALFVTRGFGDLLLIGDQQRPDLFALDVRKPAPLYERSLEVTGRLAADGSEVEPLDLDALRPTAERLAAEGVRSAALALLHSCRDASHEQAAAAALRQAGFEHVSVSSELAPFLGILARAQTAVIDAYLGPVVDDYLRRVRNALPPGSTLHVMTSAGGLVPARAFRAANSLLSGPAGGAAGASVAGRRAGRRRVIGLDMGGTSTDVSRYDGDFEYVYEHEIAGARLVSPALAIETVAAGGGSICSFDRQGLRVGPGSAGATPGPACYGAGGPLTLTDANLLLGRLSPERFGIPVSPGQARDRASLLLADLAAATGERPRMEAVLQGLLEIANERMADAIRTVSVRRGYDPADYALVAFGGAGGQHACAVAERLGMRTIIVPPDAGLLSALGLGSAVIEQFAQRQVLRPLLEVEPDIPRWVEELVAQAAAALTAQGVGRAEVVVRRRMAHLRLVGQDSTLPIELAPGVSPASAFADRYRAVYGHRPGRRPVELESLGVVVSTAATDPGRGAAPAHAAGPARRTVRAWFGGRWVEAAAADRGSLAAGARLPGPALIEEAHSVTVVEPGWEAVVDAEGAIVLQAGAPAPATGVARPEAVLLELFTNRFRAVAEEMGEMLRRTALSTNVKERLDFSCALLDSGGELVVNAPHIPVHLGALGLCVRSVAAAVEMAPGDVVVTNHPAFGGSHLPDVTAITPVFTQTDGLVGYVASRAHHAEIGGARPGSMPPMATTLAEEGVVIPPTYLVREGRARWSALRRVLSSGPFPSRSVDENLSDLRAAVAANQRGAAALAALAERHGVDVVRRYMRALTLEAERLLREALRRLPSGCYRAEERLDDGSPLRVAVRIEGDSAEIDFAGTAGVHPGNLNATPAVVRSAVIYVLRLLVGEPLPLNEGLMRPVTLRVPPGMLNPPFDADPAQCPAVVGGNVETSQRLVDTLLKALQLAACSQGTMNNVLWGTDRLGYYETVGGGTGAGPTFPGADAVHSHMTNTRITDAEVLEHRYPVRVDRFAVRRGSGGVGRHRGGDGIVRELTFLAPLALSVVTQHRTQGPYGLAGAGPGQPGSQCIVRSDGSVEPMGPIDARDVGPGDRLILETPGGGGYGPE